MENASKALIIAGAILLSILIISLGIMIYNQAAGVVNNNAMDEVEISTFNNKFLQYTGNNVRGANVNALIQAIDNNNNSQDDDSKKVTIVKKGTTTAFTKAETGKKYAVTVKDYTSGGLIETIEVDG